MKLRSGPHSPDRSGLPSAVRGTAPVGPAWRFAKLASDAPPPAGSVAAPCAPAGTEAQDKMITIAAAASIERMGTSVLSSTLSLSRGGGLRDRRRTQDPKIDCIGQRL